MGGGSETLTLDRQIEWLKRQELSEQLTELLPEIANPYLREFASCHTSLSTPLLRDPKEFVNTQDVKSIGELTSMHVSVEIQLNLALSDSTSSSI